MVSAVACNVLYPLHLQTLWLQKLKQPLNTCTFNPFRVESESYYGCISTHFPRPDFESEGPPIWNVQTSGKTTQHNHRCISVKCWPQCKFSQISLRFCVFRAVVSGGAEGALAPPEFGSSGYPIPNRGGRLCPPHHPQIPKPNDSSAM